MLLISNYACTYFLYLCVYFIILCTYVWIYPVARIITPPENTTVCRDDDVTISCGYQSDVRLPVIWTINGISYNELALESIVGYHLNNKSHPEGYSLTIHSMRYTTTVQCRICSPPKYSTRGTVNVIGMYILVQLFYTHVHIHLVHTYYRYTVIYVPTSDCIIITINLQNFTGVNFHKSAQYSYSASKPSQFGCSKARTPCH